MAVGAADEAEAISEQRPWADLVGTLGQVTGPVRRSGWLDVLAPVLARASDRRIPVLERARLLAVFSLHLDALFMIRVAGSRGTAAGLTTRSAALPRRGLLPALLQVFTGAHDRLLHDDVLPALAAEGVGFPGWDDLNDPEQAHLRQLFRDVIHPLVTPWVVDATHPFPYVSALSLNLGLLVRDRRTGAERFACVQVPTRLPGFVRLDGTRSVGIDAIVRASLGELFQGMQILERSSFRVTRNETFGGGEEVDGGGGVDGGGEVDGEPRIVLRGANLSRRLGLPARLEVEDTTSARMLEILVRNLGVAREDVYRVRAPLGMAATMLAITGDRPSTLAGATNRPTRAAPPHVPVSPSSDVLTGRAFLERATSDPTVLVIAQTLSRRVDATVVAALIDAATAGKQVLVILEDRARDRERMPSTLVHRLASVGCQVVYGPARAPGACVLGLALCEAGSNEHRTYAHVGTPGHYASANGDPSHLGLVSANPEVCADVAGQLLRLAQWSHYEGHAENLLDRRLAQ